ncbi:hypothetical protein F4818DRAFT_217804 [Hypoxylon cercidicola]|nr:hypothetical protein F4818DRAFT_217804 [Hypoxylon cercidicola]
MSTSSTTTELGVLVLLDSPEKGSNVWTARQYEQGIPKTPYLGSPKKRIDIDWSFSGGVLRIKGYVDTGTLEAVLTLSVLGVNVGTISGNLKDGIGMKINLFVAQGEIKLYLKNGNELWIHLELKILGDGSYKGDYKIISW